MPSQVVANPNRGRRAAAAADMLARLDPARVGALATAVVGYVVNTWPPGLGPQSVLLFLSTEGETDRAGFDAVVHHGACARPAMPQAPVR